MRQLFTSMIILLALTFASTQAMAQDNYTGKAGPDITYSYDPTTRTLTLTGTGPMDVPSPRPWDSWLDSDGYINIENVVIGEGITEVGFLNNLKKITSITLPSTTKKILNNAFSYSGKLIEEIIIPEGVTMIGEEAFKFNSVFKVSIPSTVTNIGKQAFMYIHGMAHITVHWILPYDIPNFADWELADWPFLSDYVPNMKLYVPFGIAELYKAKKMWQEMEIIEEEEKFPIDEETFPDPKFRELVIEYIAGGNDYLTSSIISKTSSINCWRYNDIESLQGIEVFTELTELFCTSNKITSIDLSKNTKLKTLDCRDNQITELNLTGCTALNSLKCGNNQLTTLDLSSCNALKDLECSDNQLTTLDLSNFNALDDLSCSSNQLTELNVSQNKELTHISCYNNQIGSLQLNNNTKLEYIDCTDNQLKYLFTDNNTQLYYLDCSNNKIKELDLRKNTNISRLFCSQNNLTELDVTANTLLVYLACANNQISKLNLKYNTKLSNLDCSSNQLSELDIEGMTDLRELSCSNNIINEENMEKLIRNLPVTNGIITPIMNNGVDKNVFTTDLYDMAVAKGWTVTATITLFGEPIAVFYDGYPFGDVNKDGKVNVADVVMLSNMICEGKYIKSLDIDNDGKTGALELTMLVNLIYGDIGNWYLNNFGYAR